MRKNSIAVLICTVFVIIAMAAGIFIGMMMGKSKSGNQDTNQNTEPSEQTDSSGGSMIDELNPDTDNDPDTLPEVETDPEDNGMESSVVVITVGSQKLTMEELNYHLYSMRDRYVEAYGEEPWDQVLDNGQTVMEAAKETLKEELIEKMTLLEHVADYNVELPDAMAQDCESDAQSLVDTLGPEIITEFGFTQPAVAKVFKDIELSGLVKNAVNEAIEAELQSQDLSDEEYELKSAEAYVNKIKEWEDELEINIDSIWDSIVVGSVG